MASCPECGDELEEGWCYDCMALYPQPTVQNVQAAFARYCAEAETVINGLIGAMPPALQRRWPNIITRARRLTSLPPDGLERSVPVTAKTTI